MIKMHESGMVVCGTDIFEMEALILFITCMLVLSQSNVQHLSAEHTKSHLIQKSSAPGIAIH
jgi:hypothetical protein